MIPAFSGKCNASVWCLSIHLSIRPSIRLSHLFSNLNGARCILNMTYQWAAHDVGGVHFPWSITRKDILVLNECVR